MSCNCENKAIELYIKKGESKGFAFTLYENGAPIDLTGGSIIFQVRDNVVDSGTYLINKTITTSSNIETTGKITDAEKGEFTIKVTSSDISSLLTTRPYFMAIYYSVGGIIRCVSADGDSVGQFVVLNP